MRPILRVPGVLVALSLALFGCGGGDAEDSLDPDGGGATPTRDGATLPTGGARPQDASVSGSNEDTGPPADAVPSADARLPSADGAPPAPDVPTAPPVVTPTVELPARRCEVTLAFDASPGTREVRVAGDFTGWAARAVARAGPDAAGRFAVTLGPQQGLQPGAVHAYKLIVDGTWRLDPGQPRQRYVDACVNSAFQVPDCDARPDLEGLRVEAGADGSFVAEVGLSAATTGATRGNATFDLAGHALASQWDAARGVYRVTAAGLPRGRHTLRVTARDEDAREAEPLSLPFWIEERAFDWRNATLYMLMVDRFANGNKDLDAPAPEDVPRAHDWHGGDLEGVRRALEAGYFDELGVNALWLSPINAQTNRVHGGRDPGNQRFAGYHGYWPVRGRQVEDRFGGDEALRTLVRAAHARGIRVLLDLVNNQIHEDHEYLAANPEWFRRGCVCGTDPGCGWSERPLDCLFAPYLPDIDWRVPGAETQFIADAEHWIEAFEVDGFRIDAVKHVETTAIYNLRDRVQARFAAPGAARVVMFGETAVGEGDRYDDGCGERYGDGYAWISAYDGPNALDGQFDFPSHHRMQWGLLTGELGLDGFEAIVADMGRRYDPDAVHVRFLGSHDSNRMASRAARDPAMDCRYPGGGVCENLPGLSDDPAVFARLARAFTALYTLPGIPLLYMGDELGQPGGGDPDNRRDMLFDVELDPIALGLARPSRLQAALKAHVAALGRARRDSGALGVGTRRVLVAEADLSLVEWTAGDRRAVVALNRSPTPLERTLPELRWPLEAQAAAGEGTLRPGDQGTQIRVPAGGSAVWLQ